jgi:hypothetical protein
MAECKTFIMLHEIGAIKRKKAKKQNERAIQRREAREKVNKGHRRKE